MPGIIDSRLFQATSPERELLGGCEKVKSDDVCVAKEQAGDWITLWDRDFTSTASYSNKAHSPPVGGLAGGGGHYDCPFVLAGPPLIGRTPLPESEAR